jgi:hypothetical protein
VFFPILEMLDSLFFSLQFFEGFLPLLHQLDGSLLPAVPHEDEGVGHCDQREEHAEAEVKHETKLGLGEGAQRVTDVEAEREEPVEKGKPPGSGFGVGHVGDVRVGREEEAGAAARAIFAKSRNLSHKNVTFI